MPYSGPEYWNVIYRAVADFGDLISEAAKAKAALSDLSKAAKAEGEAEAGAAAKAAAAHKADAAAINDERNALLALAAAAKAAAVWTEFGGRESMPQHLSDLAQELNWMTLINRQKWLGFTNPQAAYSWRQLELYQAYLMNRARFGATSSGTGYTTPDQYLSYLQREYVAERDLSQVMVERAAIYKSNAEAYLAYANALKGHAGTLGTLSEGNLASAQAYEAALAGLPPEVTTRLSLDDSAFIARLAADRAMLTGFSRTYTARDIITASYELGAVPLDRPQVIPYSYQQAGPGPEAPQPEVIPVSFGGPWQEQYAAVMAEIARLNEMRAEIPVTFDITDPGAVAAAVAAFPQRGEVWSMAGHLPKLEPSGAAGGGGGPPPEAAARWRDLVAAEDAAWTASRSAGLAELQAAHDVAESGLSAEAAARAWQLLGEAKREALAAAGAAPPLPPGGPPAPPAAFGPDPGDEQAWARLLAAIQGTARAEDLAAAAAHQGFGPPPQDAAEWAALARQVRDYEAAAAQAEGMAVLHAPYEVPAPAGQAAAAAAITDTGDAAAAAAVKLAMLAAVQAGDADSAAKLAFAWKALGGAARDAATEAELASVRQAIMAASAAEDAAAVSKLTFAYQALSGAEKDAGDGAGSAAAKTKTVADVLGAAAGYLQAAGTGWAVLNARLLVFSGLMGAVSVWHLLFDALLETVIVLVTALTTLAAGLGAFILVGNLAQDTLGRISDRLKATYTAATATGQAIYPVTNAFDGLAKVIRPQVWQLYGDALTLASGKIGLIGQLATSTGSVLDRFGARFVVDLQQGGQAIAKFLADGAHNLAGLGQVFANVGHILASLIMVAERTHIAEDLVSITAALTGLLARLSDLIRTPVGGWIATVVIGLHGLWIWGGLAATGILGVARNLALMAGGVSEADSALGLLPARASGFQRFAAILSDIGAGFAALPGRITGTRTAIQQVADASGASESALARLRREAEEAGKSVAEMLPATQRAKIAGFAGDLSDADREMLALAARAGAGEAELAAFADKLGGTSDNVVKLATATERGAGLFDRYGSTLDAAGQGAVALAIAGGKTETEVASVASAAEKAAAGTGKFGLALTALRGALPGGPVVWAALLGAALNGIAIYLGFLPDRTQKWITTLNAAVNSADVFHVIGATVSALAANTEQLASAQKTATGNVTELAVNQADLTGKLGLELTRVGGLQRAYGVDMPAALGLLNAAGVKASALFSDQNKVWATARQQVAGLVTGYQAMGQGLTQLQGDVSVQLVMGSDQLKQMGQLNQAWDQWIATVTGGESAFVKFQQALATANTDAGKAGAAMGGLNAQSLTLRSSYLQLLPSAGQVLDAIRTQSAVLQDGAQGSAILTRATRDLAAQMYPLAAGNKAAQDSLLALVQEADPSVNTWQKLTRWVGNQGAAQAAADLDAIMTKLETPVSNLAADAARLTTTLQQDLNPAMAQAAFNALGVQQKFGVFAADVQKFGPGSQVTIQAAGKVADVLLAIDKNSSAAHDQFVAWAESMGIAQPAAEKLWQSAYKLTSAHYKIQLEDNIKAEQDNIKSLEQQLSRTTDPAKRRQIELQIQYDQGKLAQFEQDLKKASGSSDQLRSSLAKGSEAVADLGRPGLWGQFEHAAMSVADRVGHFFGTTFPAFFTRDIPAAAGTVERFFTGPFVQFFTGTVGPAITGAWAHVWSALVSPVVHAFDDIKGAVVRGFDGWWKSHGQEVVDLWQVPLHGMEVAWDKTIGFFKQAWDGFTTWLKTSGGGHVLSELWTGAEGVAREFWDNLKTVAKTAWDFITTTFKVAWALMTGTAKAVWDALWNGIVTVVKFVADTLIMSFKVGWTAVKDTAKAVWDAIVGLVSVALDLITGHWGKAWSDMKTAADQVWNAIKDFGVTVWDAVTRYLKQVWDLIWGELKKTGEQVWSALYAAGKTAVLNTWHFFDNDLIHPLQNFFLVTIPRWFDALVSTAKGAWRSVTSWFTSDVALPIGRAIGAFAGDISNAFKSGWDAVAGWFNNHVIDWINNNILKHLPGGLAIPHIPEFAGGGAVPAAAGFAGGRLTGMAAGGALGRPYRYSGPGSVPGTGDEDGTHIVAMGGEYMVRKPARMALEAVYGRGFMDMLNQADSWLAAGSRGSAATQRRRHPGTWVPYAAGGTPPPPGAYAGMASGGPVYLATGGDYQNPLRGGSFQGGRIDMGVDYTGSGPLYAIGPGIITNVWNSGWPGGVFIGEELKAGQYLGMYTYMAENIAPYVQPGMAVTSNTKVGYARGSYPFIEIGWAAPPGTGETMAAAAHQQSPGGDPGSRSTAYGLAMSNFLRSLGAPGGILQGGRAYGSLNAVLSPVSVWQAIEGLLDSAGNALGDLVKPLARWVSGGAAELLKLAEQGARSIFDFIWGHTIQPLVDQMPGRDTLPGAFALDVAATIKAGIDNFLGGQDQNAQAQAASASSAGGIGPVSGPADAGPGQAMNYARGRLSAYGWDAGQFTPLQELWNRESGWNRFARNPSSGAYGIPQALPPTKLPFAGQAGGGSHASPQIDWGLGYIKASYGDPDAAWSHEVQAGWYPSGGPVGEFEAAFRRGMAQDTPAGERAALELLRRIGWYPPGRLVPPDREGSAPPGGSVPAPVPAMPPGRLVPPTRRPRNVPPTGFPFGGIIGQYAAGGPLGDWSALTAAVRGEMAAMDAIQRARLPARGPSMAERHAFTAWQEALWAQQLKTVGLGRTPPGAFGVLSAGAASPEKMTAGQWSAFTGNLAYLTREEEGPGAGGITPPGTPANSGWPAWRWLRPQWSALLGALRTAGTRAQEAQVQWGSRYSLVPVGPGGSGQAPIDSPEWDSAARLMNDAVRAEMNDFWALMGMHLPARGPTMSQRHAWTSWQHALAGQQLKTVGLGRRPPGAYQAISDRLTAPGTITGGQWSAFLGDLGYLIREEEGPGVPGGINPPGTPANSGWPAWKYLHPQWRALLDAMRAAQSRTRAAEGIWARLYGPGHLPYTPGPKGGPPVVPPPGGMVNVMPEATLGGPGAPVFNLAPGTTGYGFASGGGLDQVAAMFSGGLDPGGVMLPVVVRYGVPDSVLRQLSGAQASQDHPRRLSEAGAASRQGAAINFEQVTINNPLPQRPSDSIAHATARLAFLAGRGMS